MSTESATIVQRLWNYCNVLRDDGVSYGDYVEQLTYLLFLNKDTYALRGPRSPKRSRKAKKNLKRSPSSWIPTRPARPAGFADNFPWNLGWISV